MAQQRIHAHTNTKETQRISALVKRENLLFLNQLLDEGVARSRSHAIDICIDSVRRASQENADFFKSIVDKVKTELIH